MHGYSGVTARCRAWWKALGILPVPGRKNVYDPKQVRRRLDEAAGLKPQDEIDGSSQTASLVAQRKARKRAH